MSLLFALLCVLPQSMSAAPGPRSVQLEPEDPNGFFVDPVNGEDVGDGREEDRPWRTLTYALAHVYGGPVIQLAPGEYSEASGERFPLVLDRGMVILGQQRSARIVGPSDPSVPVFQVLEGGIFESFEVVALGAAFDVFLDYSSFFDSVEVSAARAVDVRTDELFIGYLTFARCLFRTEQSCIALTGTLATAIDGVQIDVRDSLFSAGSEAAIVDFRSGGFGRVRMRCTNSAFHGARSGLWLRPADPLDLELDVEGCVFHGLGNESGGGPLVVEGADSLRVEIARSIFWRNHRRNDLPGYDPATYRLEQNLFEQPRLVGVGGSVSGDPRFADAAAGDFHLRADSAARGVAASADTTQDREFDPRGVGLDDDRVDLGLDEFFPRYHWFHPRPRNGETATLRITGEPRELALAFASRVNLGTFGYWGPPLGVGWQLGVLLSPRPFALARIDEDGLAEIPVTFSFGGPLALLTQVVYVRPQGNLEVSTNAAFVVVTD